MDSLIVLAAQALPFVPPVVAVAVWFTRPRRQRLPLAVRTVAAVGLTALLVLTAGFVHSDPRPFAVDPSHPALFAHGPDNGFPSDHTAYAATAALLVMLVRRRLGLVMILVAAVGGGARVAANVHHVQDVLTSLVIAGISVALVAVALAHVTPLRLSNRTRVIRGDHAKHESPGSAAAVVVKAAAGHGDLVPRFAHEGVVAHGGAGQVDVEKDCGTRGFEQGGGQH
jgi:undecaprenyl-diphosphatase